MPDQGRHRNMHPADIRAAVWKAGGTFKGIADRHGLHRTTVGAACYRPQPAGNRAIAEFLGTTPHAIWPEWFGPDGTRRTSHGRNATETRVPRHRQKREAA